MPKKRNILKVEKGKVKFEYVGLEEHPLTDLYHFLLQAAWPKFIFILFGFFLFTNLSFAALYLLGGNCLNSPQPGSWFDAFSFSVQTLSTIGYGAMYPTTTYAKVISNIEAFLGLFLTATMAGLLFAKFSRPRARINFSQMALITPMNGTLTLQIRMANLRTTTITNAQARLYALMEQSTQEGQTLRRPVELKLQRSETPLFSLSWTLIHVLDEQSPLWGLSEENKADKILGLILSFSGIETNFAGQVHATYTYSPDKIVFKAKFRDMHTSLDNGAIRIDHTKLHEYEVL